MTDFSKLISSRLCITSPGRQLFTRLLCVISIAAVLIVLISVVLLLPTVRKFVIVEEKTGKILYYSDVKPGDTFTVTYTHSVNNSPVHDIFVIREDYSIMLKKTVFSSFGAGVPYEVEKGQNICFYKDTIEIDNINQPIKEYLLFVGTVADHIFTMHQASIPLKQLTRQQQTVRFEVHRVPLCTVWLKRDKE